MVRCLSNRGAAVRKGKKRTRVEENSGVQMMEERRVRCGEISTGMRCGDGPARKKRGQPGRPPARGTRTINMCSSDARIRGSTRPPPKEIDKRGWEGWGGCPVDLLCARNAHDRNVLVRRPQSGLTRVPVPRGEMSAFRRREGA